MPVVISKASNLNDDLWNEWSAIIRSFITDADKNYIKYDELVKKMFNVSNSKRFGEKTTGLTEFGDFDIVGEAYDATHGKATLDDLQETFPKLITHQELKKKMTITKTMIEDSQLDMIKQKTENFVKAYKRSRAAFATAMLCGEGATASFGGVSTLDRTTGDGQALFATGHIIKKTAATVSNVYTDAFSPAVLIELASIMRNFKNESGNAVGFTANKIIVPGNCPALEEQVKRLINSDHVIASDWNDVNTQKGMWELVVNPLWEAASGTAPYIIMSDDANQELLGNQFYDRTGLEVKEDVDIDTHNLSYSGRFRMGAGFFNWRQVIMGGATTGSSL